MNPSEEYHKRIREVRIYAEKVQKQIIHSQDK